MTDQTRRADVCALVARGDAQVGGGDRDGEGVDGLVEAALVRRDRQRGDDPLAELGLRREREVTVQAARVGRFGGGEAVEQGPQAVTQARQHGLELRRSHPRLVVVQQRVVGVLVGGEAVDVGAGELDVALQGWEEGGEVRRLARLDPRPLPVGGRPRQLGPQLGGDAARLGGVATCDANQAGIVGVGRLGGDLLRRSVEELGELVRDQQLMAHPRERRELLGPCRAAGLGHLGPLVPCEQAAAEEMSAMVARRSRASSIVLIARAGYARAANGVGTVRPSVQKRRVGLKERAPTCRRSRRGGSSEVRRTVWGDAG